MKHPCDSCPIKFINSASLKRRKDANVVQNIDTGVVSVRTPEVTAKLISAFVFATRIVLFLLYLNPKFQTSSSFLCLYRLVCVGPVRKPHCWFSHGAAHYCKFVIVSTNNRSLNIEEPEPCIHPTRSQALKCHFTQDQNTAPDKQHNYRYTKQRPENTGHYNNIRTRMDRLHIPTDNVSTEELLNDLELSSSDLPLDEDTNQDT